MNRKIKKNIFLFNKEDAVLFDKVEIPFKVQVHFCLREFLGLGLDAAFGAG